MQVGFNNGVPINEEFFIENISGRHNEDLCGILLPNWDLPKARKFLQDKETYFCRFGFGFIVLMFVCFLEHSYN